MTTDDVLFFRFDEATDDVLPSDAMGNLEDLHADGTATLPSVSEAFAGYAREFIALDATGLRGKDLAGRDTLLTRTCSVQALIRWDIDDQDAAAQNGTIICHGIGASDDERVSMGLELRVVNAGARIGELRWYWEDLAGARHNAVGGQFQLATAHPEIMLTATRRWISTEEVVVRYYLGKVLLNEAIETQGEIGGGTLGTTTVGGRITDGDEAWTDHFDGAIDELRVVGRELVAEEIAATWDRITVYQPRGHALVLDCLPPGFPVSDDPESRVAREHRLTGFALGYAIAQGENVRANIAPDRAYGPILTRWETITRQPPRAGDSVDDRRRRVVGHMRQRAGVSPPGVRTALRDLLACNADQIQVVAYSNRITDGFDEMRERRWRRTPDPDEWTIDAGALRVLLPDGTEYPVLTPHWRTCLTGVDGPERIGFYGAQIFAKLDPANLPDNGEAGLVLYDWPRGDVMLLGLRRDGADYKVITQRWFRGVEQAAVVHATTALDPHWLHLYQRPLEYDGQSLSDLVEHGIRWSTTGPSSGFTTVNGIDFSFSVGWCGFYARTWDGAIASDLDVKFDDAALLFPHGRRSCRFYALRDPDIPGNYDLAGASAVLKRMKQAHTHAAAITSLAFLAGDPESLCGRGPCGEGEGTAAGWTIDAGAGLGTPETASEWDAVLEDAGIASGGPVSIYPMQDAAGDLVDANAVEDLAALGVAATYLDAVPGWTRKGVTFADGIATRFEATIGAGDTESFLFVLYVRVTGVPAAIRSIVEHPNVYAEISTVPRIRANGGSVVTGAVDPGTDVHMIVVQSDRAASVLRVITEDEVLEPVDIEVATTTMVLGGTAASPGMTTLLGARFTGAAAELSRAEIKALYETLGWTVAWVP